MAEKTLEHTTDVTFYRVTEPGSLSGLTIAAPLVKSSLKNLSS